MAKKKKTSSSSSGSGRRSRADDAQRRRVLKARILHLGRQLRCKAAGKLDRHAFEALYSELGQREKDLASLKR